MTVLLNLTCLRLLGASLPLLPSPPPEPDVVVVAGGAAVALTAGKNCSALKDPEKHRPAIDNNTIAGIMIFTVLSIIKRL